MNVELGYDMGGGNKSDDSGESSAAVAHIYGQLDPQIISFSGSSGIDDDVA